MANFAILTAKNIVRFLILSKASTRFLSPPSTSQPSDQLFSHARDVFHYKRCLLDPYNAEQLIFLNRALHDVNFLY
uniref:HAT C-terminal dimerisation domain-containing protein n=1 Tax=Ditylenchus dipsaci TaxID=166011 RepID=A0A915D8K1_9BILA